MRFSILLAFLTLPAVATAQQPASPPALSSADSALIAAILLAEDRRDASSRALVDGVRHADARVRTIAQRARGRITDARFAARDSLPPVTAAVVWPEPAWKARYRALEGKRGDCDALGAAMADDAWAVRLRAVDLLGPACATDEAVIDTLRAWIDALPRDASHRQAGGVSWHAAARAAVALARLQPDLADEWFPGIVAHDQWQVRLYAVRAAVALSDTAALRALARDPDDNVKEGAIDALSKLTGHADDSLYVAALGADGVQAVRAAALALKDSPRPDVHEAASAAFERLAARGSESERDARIALLQAAGRPAGADRPPLVAPELPPDAVALALGEDVRLRVTMAPFSGGGSFVVRLRGDVAPIMAARILELVRRGYYDGLSWQRVEPDFVIQGGSPGANEYVGHERYLRDELGTLSHRRGTVGMSTRGHDTGDAQWFINMKDNPRLDRDYTVFAEVVEGMNIVDGILEGDVIERIEVLP